MDYEDNILNSNDENDGFNPLVADDELDLEDEDLDIADVPDTGDIDEAY